MKSTKDIARRRASRLAPKAAALLALALAQALAGCAGPRQNYDLTAAAASARLPHGTLVVDVPTAATPLGGQLIVVREGDDRLASLGGAQWADQLTALVQSRTVQTFENAGLLRNLRLSGQPADYRLVLSIRRFDIDAPQRLARVEIAAQLVTDSGQVRAAKIFSASEPVAEIAGAGPPLALNGALGRVLPQIVVWTAAAI